MLSEQVVGYFIHSLQIVIAEAVFGVCFKRRKLFVLRVCLSLIGYFALSVGLAILFERFLPQLCFIIAIVLSFALYPVCFHLNIWDGFFCCLAAIAIQDFSYSLSTIVITFFGFDPQFLSPAPTVVLLLVYIVVQVGCFFFCLKRLRGVEGGYGSEHISMVVLSLILTLAVNVIQYDRQALDTIDFYLWKAVFISYDILLIIMLFGMYNRHRLRKENAVLSTLRESEARQYELDKRVIEMVNIKCHDLKHQLIALRDRKDDDLDLALADVENAVMIYDSIARTNCKALDVILTNKCLLCEKYGIRITYIVDGEKLSFMKSVDIYSLFGNAIDNAIRAVKGEEDEEKRMINISVTAQGRLLSVHIENYCAESPKFVDGLPVTGSGDPDNHGFGMISMKRIVEDYGGAMSVQYEYPLFSVDCVIPIADPVSE